MREPEPMIGLARNSWTKGHFALLRVLLGLAVAAAGISQLLAAGSWLRPSLGLLELLCGLLVAAGRAEVPAALLAAGLWLGLGAAGPLGDQAGMVGGALLLIRHAALAPAAAVAGLRWVMPSWVLLLSRLALIGVLIAEAASAPGFPQAFDLAGFVLLALAAAEPAWIPGRRAGGPERVFFDGGCGLCHRGVLFLLQEDRAELLRFAPLHGETFRRLFPPDHAAALPDSLVVVRDDGAPLLRSAAVVHLCSRLGGAWRPLGFLLRLVPRGIADGGYDWVAGFRERLFARPESACPMVPPALRWRFEA